VRVPMRHNRLEPIQILPNLRAFRIVLVRRQREELTLPQYLVVFEPPGVGLLRKLCTHRNGSLFHHREILTQLEPLNLVPEICRLYPGGGTACRTSRDSSSALPHRHTFPANKGS
jgi:hypothetical protein